VRGSLFFIIAFYHILHIKEIPIIDIISNWNIAKKELLIKRELSSKLLDVPLVMKYLFSCATSVFLPIALLLLIKQNKRYSFILISLFGIFYALITTAKTPIVIVLIIIVLFFLVQIKTINIMKSCIVIIITLIIALRLYFVLSSEMQNINFLNAKYIQNHLSVPSEDPRNNITMGDYIRFYHTDNVEYKLYSYIIYRVFLVPSEVSNRWYQYYPNINGSYEGIIDYFPGQRNKDYIHPSRKIGVWAYHERSPNYFLKTANAYSSVDADIYARLGIIGIILISILLIGLRIVIKKLFLINNFGLILNVIAIAQISFFLPSASLPAILVAHGLSFVLLLMVINNIIFSKEKHDLYI